MSELHPVPLYYEVHVTIARDAEKDPRALHDILGVQMFWPSVVDKEDEAGRELIATRRCVTFFAAHVAMQGLTEALKVHGFEVTRTKIEGAVLDTKAVKV